MSSGIRSWFKVRLITGFFVTVPAIATAWLLYVFWSAIDNFFSPGYQQELFGRRIPGLGILTAVVVMFLVGTVAANVMGRRFLSWGEGLLVRLPLFRRVYPSVKQLFESFSPERGYSFREVILVEHLRKGEYVFGFITGEVLVEESKGPREMVTVYIPTNHLYLGDVILLPKEEVIPTGLSVEHGIRIILSAGAAAPPRLGPPRSLSSEPGPSRVLSRVPWSPSVPSDLRRAPGQSQAERGE